VMGVFLPRSVSRLLAKRIVLTTRDVVKECWGTHELNIGPRLEDGLEESGEQLQVLVAVTLVDEAAEVQRPTAPRSSTDSV